MAQGALTWRHWGDEWVVHDARAAKTHLLSDGAGAVLLELLVTGACLSSGEIWCRLFVGGVDSTVSEEPTLYERQSLETILTELAQLGLIEKRRL